METLQEIRVALTRLPIDDRLAIGAWLQEYDGPGTRAYGVREPGSTYAAPEPLIRAISWSRLPTRVRRRSSIGIPRQIGFGCNRQIRR